MQDLGQNRIEETLQALEELGISGELVRHPAVFTIEEMERLGIALRGEVVKNLFLRDDKGRRHFLVLLPHDKAADLAALRTLLSSSKLSFASPERLMKYLGLTPGSVTVLGLLHEGAAPVEVCRDAAEAYARAAAYAGKTGAMIVCAGSLYLAGEMLDLLEETAGE